MKYDLKNIFKEVGAERKFNEPMSRYTSFCIGGKADVIIFPGNTEELRKVVSISADREIPLFVLGYGTNLIVRDSGIRGVVVSLTKGFRNIEMVKSTDKSVHIIVGAGLQLSRAIQFCLDSSLGGLEGLSGIPGSIGGAIISNAGTQDGEIKDIVQSVRLMDKRGRIKVFDREKITFGYRSSSIPKGNIIIDAVLALKKTDKRKSKKIIEDSLRGRRESQPFSFPSAGSIFKNPEGGKAYKIIDDIGMRGTQIGDAYVSKKHANFIINKGNAKASDIIKLMNSIKRKAKSEKGVSLEPEVVIVGEKGKRFMDDPCKN